MKPLISILSLLLFSFAAYAKDFSSCFIPGEVAEYKVTWMGIPLAWSKTTTEQFTEDGKDLIRVRMESKTYKAYAHIYKVDDLWEVIVDPETALPRRFNFTLREGGRRKNHTTLFDHKNLSATFIDLDAQTTNSVPIQSDTRDILTFMYSIRNVPMNQLPENVYTLFVDGKLHEMGIQIRKENDKVKLPEYGKVMCTEVEPLAEFDGLFLREGKIFFWVSKENRRMITCVHAKVPVGKVRVKLQKISGPGDDFWVQGDNDE